jgi:hypothetical protein
MPDRDRAALDGFIAELRRVWTLAGPPSYEEFRKLSTRVKGPARADVLWLSPSTTQEILAGRRQQPPKWRWVARFITVLRVAAEDAGIDADRIGTLAEWKRKHETVCRTAIAEPQLAQAAGGRVLRRDFGARAAGGTSVHQRTTSPLLNETDAARDPELAALLGAIGPDWWRDYQDPVPDWHQAYLGLELATCLIRAYETTIVPGWLQTEEYAAAAIRLSWLTLDQPRIGRLVELRMHRQQFLERAGGPDLWVVMDEAAVRHRLGSRGTMRAQIRHLIEVSQRPDITIQLIPVDNNVHAVAGGPITLLRFPSSNLPDVVYLEQLTGAIYIRRPEDVSHYLEVLSFLGVEGLTPEATRDFLTEILAEI